MLFFILISSTELHTLNFWIWNSFSFNCFFFVFFFFTSIWLHTIQLQFWLQTDAIPSHMFSWFHFTFWFVFFAWPFSFSPSIEPSVFYGNSRSTDQLIAFVCNRCYCYCCCCSVFFFAFTLFIRFSNVCAMVVLMSVFIYSWFSCLCDKDGRQQRSNGVRFFHEWYTSSTIFS